jgi:hypothetical protein
MRLEHVGNAKVTTSTAEIDAAALVIPLADTTNWPTGQIGPFWVAANKGLPNEEKILCSGRAGNSLQVLSDVSGNGRGGDGTVAQTHPINSTFEHVWTASEADAANAHIESADGAHGYPPKDDLVTLDGNQHITGTKTMDTPILEAPIVNDATITGGSVDQAVHVKSDFLKALGAQAEAEFRVRNTYIGSGPPDNALGNDGDMYVDKG